MSQQPKPRPTRVTIFLSTPCADTTCRHPYNWHVPGGICQAGDEKHCGCIAFAIPATTEEPAR